MAAEQDWCLHCGAGASGSLRSGTSLRPMAGIAALSLLLLLGAAAAAYAALKEKSHRPLAHLAITPPVAQSAQLPTTAATVPTVPPPTTSTPTIPATSTPPVLPKTSSKPPKIPATAPTPKHAGESTTTTSKEGVKTTTTSTPATTPPPKGSTPMLLDTNAASTYNPFAYPESDFGDPSLAIDGETDTAWTAQAAPGAAPLVNAGVLVDLKSSRRVAKLRLITSTPGLTARIYGAPGPQAPAAITDPTWVPLSAVRLVRKQHAGITLGESTKSFRYILLWIIKAAVPNGGAPSQTQAVSVNEILLFPPAT